MMRFSSAALVVLIGASGIMGTATAAPSRGQQLYQMYCAACHGFRGEGVAPDAPKFQLGERLNKPDILLMQSVKAGNKTMPPFFGVLKDPEILDVLGYVRTLR